MSPIAGIAFELEYDKCDVNNAIFPWSRTTNYYPIGDTTLKYTQSVPSSSTSMTSNCTEIVRFPVAIVRVDGQDTVGQNLKIARFSFRLDIDTNAISTSVIDTLWFRFRNVKGIRANGTTFNLGAQDLPILYTKALVGLDEASDEPESFELFPNPTNSVFHLELATSPAEQGLLQIADQMGRIVLSQSIDQQSSIVNVESLPAGLYVVKITGNEMQYQPKKLLIQQR